MYKVFNIRDLAGDKESTCNVGDPSSIPGSERSFGEGIGYPLQYSWASLVAQMVKNPPGMWEIPGLGRFPGEGKGYPLQYSGLENSMDYSPWNYPGQNTGVGSLSLLQGNLPNPVFKSRSPTFQANYLPAEPQGKPKKTGVGSLSLLQRIFLTQESNQGLLHCRKILYQLSYLYSATNILCDLGKVTVLLCISVSCALIEKS